MPYDSKSDTLNHIKKVSTLLKAFSVELNKRGKVHDASKLKAPEKPLFDEYTPILAELKYGSPEYNESLKNLKPALDHHYANNSHHLEYYANGISGMNLFDLLEMFADWKAASERTATGDIFKSLEINKKRFNISDQLYSILLNTANQLFK